MISYRYQDRDTIVHRLNPFCKLLWVVCVMVLAVTFEHPVYIGMLFVASLPLVFAARIWRQWASIVIVFGFLLGVVMIFINAIIVNQGNTVLLEATFDVPTLGTPRITLEAIFYGLMWALKVVAIMSAFTLFNFTVHPDDQMLTMIQLRLPYKSVLVTSLSSRFAPTIFEDYDRLSEALRSRGLEMDKGRLLRRIANRTRLLIPLLANSLDRTVQVAEAMESRAFGQGNGRTFLKRLKVTSFDWLTLAIAFVPVILVVFNVISGYGNYTYYEKLDPIQPAAIEYALLAILLLASVSLVIMGSLKRRIDLD